MRTELLLANLMEELLKTARGAEMSFRSFLKALFLMARLIIGRGLSAFMMFWLYTPKLIKRESPTKRIELEESSKRSIGHPWSHPPMF